MSDLVRRFVEALTVAYLAFAPREIPAYRFDPNCRPVAVLQVGEPVVALVPRTSTGSMSA